MTDIGRSPSGPGSRASHEAASASSPDASIPNAWTPRPLFSHREKIRQAISDPGRVLPRLQADCGAYETLTNWQARAAIETFMWLAASSATFASAIEARQRLDRADGLDPKGESAVAESETPRSNTHD